MELDIAEIKVGHRKRKLNEEKIESLVESYKRIGQLQPVTVIKDNGMYKLLAGLHRLEAAKRSGWQLIKASLFEGDDIAAELAEIDENLMRNDLTVLEQGEHLARRQELVGYKVGKPNPATVAGLKTTNEIAKEIGISERSAHNRISVARNIVPEVKDTIRNTEIANSTTQLLELARLAPAEQVEVAKRVADGAFSIAESLKKIAKDKRENERHKLAESAKDLPADDRWNVTEGDINTYKTGKQFDFIITDPPYPREYLQLYEVLAIRANEWLKPGGLLIAMCGQSYLNQIYEMMSKHIEYYWTAAYLIPGESTSLWQKNVIPQWKPLLMFAKGKYSGKMFSDVFTSGGNEKDLHKWGQSESGMYSIISNVCLPGQSIFDPFCGSGTTGAAALKHGCLFHGIDIDKENVSISVGRLHDYSKA